MVKNRAEEGIGNLKNKIKKKKKKNQNQDMKKKKKTKKINQNQDLKKKKIHLQRCICKKVVVDNSLLIVVIPEL